MSKETPNRDMGAVSVHKLYEAIDGDAFFLKEFDGKILVCVIDGEGHGRPARDSSNALLKILEKYFRSPLTELLLRFHDELKFSASRSRSRGAAVGICLISQGRLVYCGIGNVEIKVFGEDIKPFSRSGLIGSMMPEVKERVFDYKGEGIVVMFSDGISGKFTEEDIPLERPAQDIARFIVKEYGRPTDDRTVVVIK
ncbi:MAG: serine/threonine-protein phosphatase [Candidatus Omnitrophica bacterium]|nr:serine/threonine-protein phosphatase [Candidatus Omnitrophota bacterium]